MLDLHSIYAVEVKELTNENSLTGQSENDKTGSRSRLQ